MWKKDINYGIYTIKLKRLTNGIQNFLNMQKKLNIPIFSTPFDISADFLEELDCPFYKVSSFEMTDLELIKKIAKTGKPIIISTGLLI